MDQTKFKSLALKLVKGFVAGGLASVAVALQQNHYVLQSLADLQTVGHILLNAFLTGGLLMTIKAYTWNDAGTEA